MTTHCRGLHSTSSSCGAGTLFAARFADVFRVSIVLGSHLWRSSSGHLRVVVDLARFVSDASKAQDVSQVLKVLIGFWAWLRAS